MQKVPTVGLDAIIIGSGIGGLSTAAIMAKSGKKVSNFQKVSFFAIFVRFMSFGQSKECRKLVLIMSNICLVIFCTVAIR